MKRATHLLHDARLGELRIEELTRLDGRGELGLELLVRGRRGLQAGLERHECWKQRTRE